MPFNPFADCLYTDSMKVLKEDITTNITTLEEIEAELGSDLSNIEDFIDILNK